MGKHYTSRPNFFGGGYTTYDEHGRKVSESRRNILGDGYTTYDARGRKIGRSVPNFLGSGYTYYDARGRKIGRSQRDILGDGYTTYDAHGHKTGHIVPNFFGDGYTHYDKGGHKMDHGMPDRMQHGSSGSGGCYIATCVYGSYDAPEVLTLRRFRDEVLQENVLGRAFIRCYYAVSPHLVKHFGQRTWFRNFWKKRLDKMVERLR